MQHLSVKSLVEDSDRIIPRQTIGRRAATVGRTKFRRARLFQTATQSVGTVLSYRLRSTVLMVREVLLVPRP